MPDISQIVMLVIAVGVLVLAGFGYARLGRQSPRLTVLIVGIILLVISASYQPQPSTHLDDSGNIVLTYSRPFVFLDGLIGVTGLLGLVMGLVIFFRRKADKK